MQQYKDLKSIGIVTPLAGVWIEIVSRYLILDNQRVTPLAGVWIEIAVRPADHG